MSRTMSVWIKMTPAARNMTFMGYTENSQPARGGEERLPMPRPGGKRNSVGSFEYLLKKEPKVGGGGGGLQMRAH